MAHGLGGFDGFSLISFLIFLILMAHGLGGSSLIFYVYHFNKELSTKIYREKNQRNQRRISVYLRFKKIRKKKNQRNISVYLRFKKIRYFIDMTNLHSKIENVMNKFILLIFLWLTAINSFHAQGWERLYGTPKSDEVQKVIRTLDGGFLMCGYTTEPTSAKFDIFLVKTDADGRQQWSKIVGRKGVTEQAYTALQNPDGTYLIGGVKNADSTDVSASAYLLKINALGDTIWTKTYLAGFCRNAIYDIKRLKNGAGFVAGGSACREGLLFGDDVFLMKTDNLGNPVWQKRFGIAADFEITRTVVEASDGGFIVGGVRGNYNVGDQQNLILKTDVNGNQLWLNTFGVGKPNDCTDLIANTDGGCFATGVIKTAATTETSYLKKFGGNGSEVWSRTYPDLLWAFHVSRTAEGGFALVSGNLGFSRPSELLKTDSTGNAQIRKKIALFDPTDDLKSVATTSDGGYVIAGLRTVQNNVEFHLAKINGQGDIFPFTISGNVFFDANANCQRDANETPIKNWLVKAENASQTFWGWTDTLGNYAVSVADSIVYRLSLVKPTNYWQACRDSISFSLNQSLPTVTFDFAVKASVNCPLLDIDVATPILRRCFENNYFVNYINRGTATAKNAYVKITLDKTLIFNTSTIPLSKKQDNAYFFNLGDVAQSQSGKFQFTATVRCDSTYLGQTHCVEAHIYPDSVCLPLNGWSGASINVTGSCQGDSVAFLIKNVGTAASARGIKNIVVEDNIIFLRGQVDSLSAGGSVIVKVKASGKTFRLTSEQEPNHPDFGFGGGMPTAAVEGCRTTPTLPISLGFVTQYDEDDGNPFVSIDCHQNFGSFDPNDKQTHPQGIDNQHFVNEMAELDYTVRFQNTGTDTAFTVVVRDTLSSFLDVASVRAGASSHNYQFEIVEGKILKFTFPKINLPDSTKNQAASQGFIKFLVKLKPNIPFNTVIKNSAAIFFDFNEPVITNTTFHTLRKPIRYNSKNLPLCNNTPFNGKIYTTDARVYDTLRYPKFDSVTVSILSILPTFKTTVDTSLLRGKNFNGIVIQRDTNIILRYAAKNGCDSIVTVRLRILTATVDLNRIEIKIYPNPFIEKTVIEMPTATPQYSGIWTLNLYDATGRLIATKKTKEQKFELSREDLKTGMYISEILNDKTPVAVGKLMVGR